MSAAIPAYHRPSTVETACGILSDIEWAVIVAGGQSLSLSMDQRRTPDAFVDITRIADLGEIKHSDGILTVGATVTHRDIETSPVVADAVPTLADTASQIADIQIRNAGTIGGTTAFRYHTANYPPVLVAAGAEIAATTAAGEKTHSAEAYFTRPADHQLEPTEIITAIRVPETGSNEGIAYREFSYPGHTRALVNVASRVQIAEGRCTDAIIVVGSVGDHPQLVADAATEVIGAERSTDAISRTARRASEAVEVRPQAVSTPYVREIVESLVEKTLHDAWDATGDSDE